MITTQQAQDLAATCRFEWEDIEKAAMIINKDPKARIFLKGVKPVLIVSKLIEMASQMGFSTMVDMAKNMTGEY